MPLSRLLKFALTTDLLPDFVRKYYEVHEWKHACAILNEDFPREWNDIISALQEFRLKKSWIVKPGGGGGCPILVFGISKKLYVEDE